MENFHTHIHKIDLALRAYRELYGAVKDKSNYKFILIWIRLLSLFRSSLLLSIKQKNTAPLYKFHRNLSKQIKTAEEKLQQLYSTVYHQPTKPLVQRITFLKTLTTNLLLLKSETERLIQKAHANRVQRL